LSVIPLALVGVAIHSSVMEVVGVMLLSFAIKSDDGTGPSSAAPAGPTQARPLPTEWSAASAPAIALVFRAELAGPDLAPVFVDARHDSPSEPWYHGGGIGLTLTGLITANDGRNQAKAWWTLPGAVLSDDDAGGGDDGRTSAGAPADASNDRVAELAVICHRDFVRRVCLRDEQGRILASLPAAGLDGRRLSALARAAGIHYSRYAVSWTARPSQSPTRMDCFPRAASYAYFDGPDTSMSEQVWARGEGESAGPSASRA
jgi:hypothetical protein